MIDIHRTVRGWGKKIWNVGYPQLRRKLEVSQGYTSNNVSKHPAPTKRGGTTKLEVLLWKSEKRFLCSGSYRGLPRGIRSEMRTQAEG